MGAHAARTGRLMTGRVFAIFPCGSSLVIGLVIHKVERDVDDAHDHGRVCRPGAGDASEAARGGARGRVLAAVQALIARNEQLERLLAALDRQRMKSNEGVSAGQLTLLLTELSKTQESERDRELEYVVATQIGQRRIVTIGYEDAGPYDKQL